jgi:SagB-type dehydrogenase family enzyme
MRVAAAPLTCEILHFFHRWRSAGALAQHFPYFSDVSLTRALSNLIRIGFLDRSDATANPKDKALTTWEAWSPAASYFHQSTKDSHAPIEPEDSVRMLRRRARSKPMPAPIKCYPKSRQTTLRKPQKTSAFARTLLERRTWRQFSQRPLELNQLGTLLGLTFGVQSWLDIKGIGQVALKTSPSGGARHPIEAYVMALKVGGLSPGLYHYNAGNHRLELLHRGATAAKVSSYLNGQWWFGGAAALVFMTAVFARPQWKYPASRAYRIVLIDAGHLCQTFCLAATSLGLAPFCTMAFADSKIEDDLEIDGVTESIIYAAGVGLPRKGAEAANWPARLHGRRISNGFL